MIINSSSKATHIAGGEITYKCLGGNNYQINYVFYRDCASGQAGLPNPANIDIYNSNGVLVQNLSMPLVNTTLDAGNAPNPCTAVPQGLCLEIGEYQAIVNLPPLPGGYQLVYQDIARNGGIVNGPDGSASYFTWIPDVAIASCNNSAVFNTWPPAFICAYEPLSYDLSATDLDGDSLVYSFCAPLESSFPFMPYPFYAGYSINDPLGGNSLSIDPFSGVISGTPTGWGKHVVGVCVSEYRNGILISTSSRDFQFNVVPCQSTVRTSDLQNNPLITSASTNCITKEISFFNAVQGAATYLWDFGDGFTSTDFAPIHNYSSLGNYTVTLIGYNDSLTCSDTIVIPVLVDTCRPCGMVVNVTANGGNCGAGASNVCAEVEWELLCGGGFTFTSVTSYPGVGAATHGCNTGGGPFGGGVAPLLSNVGVCHGCQPPFVPGVTLPSLSTTEAITYTNQAVCPASIQLSMNGANRVVTFNALVPAQQSGNAFVNVTGGTPPYSVQWASIPFQTGDTARVLEPGSYDVIVKDSKGCTEVVNFVIEGDSPLNVTATATDVSNCNSTDGTLTAVADSANGAVSYLWSPGGYTTAIVNNVPAGLYTVSVTDLDSCVAIDTVTVGGIPEIIMTVDVTNALCNGDSSGTANVMNTIGGSGSYTYQWNTSPIQTGASATGLANGFYTVTTTDLSGCTSDYSFTINEPTKLNLSISSEDGSCDNTTDGSATAIASGGAGGTYNYTWNTLPVQSSNTALLLVGGDTYSVSVSDSNNCVITDSVFIDNGHIHIDMVDVSTVSCIAGSFIGAAQAIPSGGSTPYTYAWSCTSQTTQTVTGMQIGVCGVTVTDSLGCTGQDIITINNITPLSSSVQVTGTCGGLSNGTAVATPIGGNFPFSYFWSCGGATTQSISGLSAGTNCTVTITDDEGCVSSSIFTIDTNQGVTLDTIVKPVCLPSNNNGSIDLIVLTGTPNFSYYWNTGDTTQDIFNLVGESYYSVSVWDSNNCYQTMNVFVPIENCAPCPVMPNFVGNVSIDICNGAINSGEAYISPNLENDYTYSWNPSNQLSSTASVLNQNSTYDVIITNKNLTHCDTIITIVIPAIDSTLENIGISKDTSINSGESIELEVTGGVSYVWSPSEILDCADCKTTIASPIETTEFLVMITSEFGCVIEKNVIVEVIFNGLIIPTAFTPDNDGINDIWTIEGIESYPDASVNIYNRWGNIIYGVENNYKGNEWNGGTYSVGSYYYLIDLKTDNESIKNEYKGALSIIK